MARKLRPEERELWKRVVETATPMRPASVDVTAPFLMPGSIKLRPSLLAPKIMAFKIGAKAPSRPSATHMGSAAKPQLTMDAKSFGKLTRGKLQPEARLDLHGMTMSEAHPMLQKFILGSAQLQRRLVLVITGKGKSKPEQGPMRKSDGVLRHNGALWLCKAPICCVSVEWTTGDQGHSGGGAFYVYLRRKR